jgi:hypothetical protein
MLEKEGGCELVDHGSVARRIIACDYFSGATTGRRTLVQSGMFVND